MQTNHWLKIVGLVALALIALSFLHSVRAVLPPFFISIVLALILNPLVERMQSNRLPRLAAVLVVFIGFAAVLVAGAIYLVPKVVTQVNQFGQDLPEYYDRGSEFASSLGARYKPLLDRFNVPTTASEAMQRFSGQIREAGKSATNILGAVLTQVLEKSIWLILVVLLTFLLLKDFDRIRGKFLYLLPDSHRERTVSIAAEVGSVFVRYLRGLIVVCALYGIAAFILFATFGVRYSLALGLAAGLLYAVPYVGSIATAVVVLLVSLAQHPDQTYIALLLMASTLVLNQIFDMLLTPRILGGAVGLHPVLSIFALMAGGAIYGIPGMVLAVPVAASAQVVLCECFPKLRKPLDKFGLEPRSRLPKKRRRKK
jgi:predicted PurR-regulated permease PerM